MITLSVVTALGLQDLAEVQVNAALQNQELNEDELREMAIFITHYVGFPLGSGFNGVVERVIAKRRKSGGGDRGANVDDALRIHGGGDPDGD